MLKGVSATHNTLPRGQCSRTCPALGCLGIPMEDSLSICLSLSHDPSSITSPLYTSGSLKEAGCKQTSVLQSRSPVQLFATLWTIARQDPLSMAGKNTGVGYHALLQGTFLTHETNLGLLSCRQILYPLNHLRSPCKATVHR